MVFHSIVHWSVYIRGAVRICMKLVMMMGIIAGQILPHLKNKLLKVFWHYALTYVGMAYKFKYIVIDKVGHWSMVDVQSYR
jgi:hypothetical protein